MLALLGALTLERALALPSAQRPSRMVLRIFKLLVQVSSTGLKDEYIETINKLGSSVRESEAAERKT